MNNPLKFKECFNKFNSPKEFLNNEELEYFNQELNRIANLLGNKGKYYKVIDGFVLLLSYTTKNFLFAREMKLPTVKELEKSNFKNIFDPKKENYGLLSVSEEDSGTLVLTKEKDALFLLKELKEIMDVLDLDVPEFQMAFDFTEKHYLNILEILNKYGSSEKIKL